MTKRKTKADESDERVRLMIRLVGHVLTAIAEDKFEAYTVLANILASSAAGSEPSRTESIHAIHTTYLQATMIVDTLWKEKERTKEEPSR